MSRLINLCVAVVILTCGGSCAFESGFDLDKAERDPRVEAMRRRMNVRLTRVDAMGEPVQTDVDAAALAGALSIGYCPSLVNSTTNCPFSGDPCYVGVCGAQVNLCVANELLNWAATGAQQSTVTYGAPGAPAYEWTVPPQSSASRAAIARQAFLWAGKAANVAELTLRENALFGCSFAAAVYALVPDSPDLTVAEAVSATLIEAHQVSAGASALELDSLLAIADGQFSDEPSVGDAAEAAWSLDVGSRSEAAHHLVGGSPGLTASTYLDAAGFCPLTRLSPGGAEALELIRISGLPPAEILGSRSIHDLIGGWPAGMPTDGLLYRLSVLLDAPNIDPTALGATITTGRFLEGVGLDVGDFVEAREYLRAELRAFGRSVDAVLPPVTVTPTTTTAGRFEIYASTRNTPVPPIPAYWAALARHRADRGESVSALPQGGPPAPDLATAVQAGVPNLSFSYDAFAVQSGAILALPALDVASRDVLVDFVPLAQDAVTARASFCSDPAQDLIHVSVVGNWSESQKIFVALLGHAGLQCALLGNVEGGGRSAGSCDVSHYVLGQAISSPADPSTGFDDVAEFWIGPLSGLRPQFADGIYRDPTDPSQVAPIFVVAQDPAYSGEPGRWTYVAGAFVEVPDGGASGLRCSTYGVSPEVELMAQSALAPSVEHCALPAETCAGVALDQRLPLENELTSEGDTVESSWRRYLDVALEAANHADALGEDLIRSGLELDVRAEAAVDELERICGVSIDVAGLAGDPTPSIGGSCSTSPCSSPYRCVSEQCVLDPVLLALSRASTSADADRLSACLGDSATTDWVTIGAAPLCFWWNGADPATICEGAASRADCPYEADASGSCGTPPAGYEVISPAAAPLGYFVRSDEPPPDEGPSDPGQLPCEELAAVRDLPPGAGRDVWARAVLGQPFFQDLPNLARLAQQITWNPRVGDFSAVRVNGVVRHGTGNPYRREMFNDWPCSEHADFAELCPRMSPETDVQAPAPLFCRQLPSGACPAPLMEDATDPYGPERVDRSRMNDMLARAVFAARIITGVGLRGVEFPFYPRARDEHVLTLSPDSPAESLACGATPPAAPVRPIDRTHFTATDKRVWHGQGGAILFDDRCSGDSAGPVLVSMFDLNRATLYQIEGVAGRAGEPGSCTTSSPLSIPVGAEWAFCPYDLLGSCVEFFDDAVDCDDPLSVTNPWERIRYDQDLGLVVRAFGPGSNGTDPRAYPSFWDGSRSPSDSGRVVVDARGPLVTRALAGDTVLLNETTVSPAQSRYWARTECGTRILGVCPPAGSASPDSSACDSNIEPSCLPYIGCAHQGYTGCQAAAEPLGLSFDETFDGNRAFIAHRGLTQEDILNGLELLCEVERSGMGAGGSQCGGEPQPIETVGDMFLAQDYLTCRAAEIHNGASRVMFRNIPSRAVALLQQAGPEGVYGTTGGEFAAAASELRAGFIDFANLSQATGTEIEAIAAEIGALQSRIQSLNLQTEIADWRLASTIMDQVTSCAVALAQLANVSVAAGLTAGATCANSVGQSIIAARITDLEQEQNQLAVSEALSTFERQVVGHLDAIERSANEVRAAIARIEAASIRIQNLQRSGRQALARSLMLDSDPGDPGADGAFGRQFHVNTVLRRRHNTARIRYEQAQRNAVRLAFLAKLALEQRLGMRMEDLTEPMTLVDEAPAGWHMDVCRMSGIDYDRIRDARPSGSGDRSEELSDVAIPEDYEGEFVGDYVRRLEMVFESYNIDYPFQDGQDTTVLSLRDQLMSIRASCDTEVPNLLYEAGQLDARTSSSGAFGWQESSCNGYPTWPPESAPPGAVSYDPPPTCVTAEALDIPQSEGPLPRWHADYGGVSGYRVHFGQPSPPMWRDASGAPVREVRTSAGLPAIGNTETTALQQWVELDAGRYRASFYGRDPDGPSVTYADPASSIVVYRLEGASSVAVPLRADASGAVVLSGESHGDSMTEGPWVRQHTFFDLSEAGWVAVGFQAPQIIGAPAYRALDVTAVMLEDVSVDVRGSLSADTTPGSGITVARSNGPRPFFNTAQTRLRSLPVCEDTTGAELRRTAFRRECVGLCPDGYGVCPGALEQHCFYETSFSLSPRSLERAGLLGTAGFAFGNFNYRIEDVGINVVGTGVTDCTESETPSACYGSGNTSYSIVHLGPFGVRNHTGHLYDAPLFTGRIERARALAAERYVTNPISSADRALIQDYLRHELRGRPLSGTYALRIWDDPTLAWENVEDIQIVLNYRYWTRQE